MGNSNEKQRTKIKLQNNLDQLICNEEYDNENSFGLFLPSKGNPGTGNIVIKGSPGTGKSTLALQILYQTVCGKDNQNDLGGGFYALYFSIEEQIDHIINKMKTFHWDNNDKECSLRKLVHLQNTDFTTSPEKLADYIKKILTQPGNCKIRYSSEKDSGGNSPCKEHLNGKQDNNRICSRVLLPMLSPKGINTSDSNNTYWERYKQIEKYLIAAEYIRTQKLQKSEKYLNVPDLKMLCIDSLNVFGDTLLEREEIFRLFDLFKRHGMIGVFIFESNRDYINRKYNQMNDDIDFASDVVISLQSDQDKGYMMRYFEVSKSRYKPQIFGKHPYAIVNPREESCGENTKAKSYLPFWVYPSLHYKLNEFAHTDETAKNDDEESRNKSIGKHFEKWKGRFGNIIPNSFERKCVIIVSGPRNTFKSTIARDFLLQGLKEEKEYINGLIISTEDKHYGDPSKWWGYKGESAGEFTEDRSVVYNPGFGRHIFDIRKWNSNDGNNKFIISIFIKKKSITSEEFIHHFQYNILKDHKNIRRVVLDEVNMIGVSYPFLQSSKTSGELFLNTFVSLLKSRDIDLIITGTTGEMPEGDAVINRAVSLSDLTLSTRFCDVFGKQNVIVTGGGLIANQKNTAGDKLIPGVLRMGENAKGHKYFNIDKEHLKGLVGFEQGRVYRPGLSINLFEEGILQKEYNKQISIMYNLSFPKHISADVHNDGNRKINILTFKDRDVEATREMIERIRDNTPLEGTVVSMVDEYWGHPEPCPKDLRRLYYTNCLVLAYRNDIFHNRLNNSGKKLSWEDIYIHANDALNEYNLKNNGNNFGKKHEDNEKTKICLMDADFFITETLSCILLDSIVSSYMQTSGTDKKHLLGCSFKDFYEGDINENLLKQLFYLNVMFNDLDKQYVKQKFGSSDKWNKMYHNSIMYICWYTQLREFLKYNPDHISKISVVGLPGGGFSGDWMIEVIPGSLSNVLGTNTLELLCKPEEELKRFIQGVGLPAWLNESEYKKYNIKGKDNTKEFDYIGGLPAWIGAADTSLNDIGRLYHYANRRKDIKGYQNFRYMLSIAFRRLMTIKFDAKSHENEKLCDFKAEAKDILEELKKHIIYILDQDDDKKNALS